MKLEQHSSKKQTILYFLNLIILFTFSHFDRDGDGYITCQELYDVLSKMGRNYTDAQIKRMIKSKDSDGNGMISVDEFEQLLK